MNEVAHIAQRALEGGPVGRDDALRLALDADLEDLLFWANRLRERFCGRVVRLCAVLNARSGACPEDCKFCAQSARHRTGVPTYPLVGRDRVLEAARDAERMGADRFGLVTSGPAVNPGDFERLCEAGREVGRSTALRPCASIGKLDPAAARRLRAAGVGRINHNLETSERFYPQVCTTHAHAERVETVRNAKAAGLEVCSGGLFGMGETWEDRVALALQLRDLGVDAVPINFLHPIPGTPFEGRPLLPPLEALRIIAVFRFVLPDREIGVCGGREVTLRDLQSWMFRAGASGTMVGSYLTTQGRSADDDLRMLDDLGLVPRSRAEA